MSHTKSVHVGCCGFAGAMSTYADNFDVVEVQQTFYQPPQLATIERWRDDVRKGFEFCIKAWQLITHESKSPTYRRLKKELSDKERTECGAFRDTRIVHEGWETTRKCAEAVGAKRILFQCPSSFKPTDQNLENMQTFFASIDRGGCEFYWEPRGNDWTSDIVLPVCQELNLSHVVDPFVSETQTPTKTYFRLHGKTGWRYVYSDAELEQLVGMLPRRGAAYVFFNNIKMREDALRFKQLL